MWSFSTQALCMTVNALGCRVETTREMCARQLMRTFKSDENNMNIYEYDLRLFIAVVTKAVKLV